VVMVVADDVHRSALSERKGPTGTTKAFALPPTSNVTLLPRAKTTWSVRVECHHHARPPFISDVRSPFKESPFLENSFEAFSTPTLMT
jgi:hypothetical protein